VAELTIFDEKHCHKWAILLKEKRNKLNQIKTTITENNFERAQSLFSEVISGSINGKHSDPGLIGSLLYHMAMVSKMEMETNLLSNEFNSPFSDHNTELQNFYGVFITDVIELSKDILSSDFSKLNSNFTNSLGSSEKINLFTTLFDKTKTVESLFNIRDNGVVLEIEKLFEDWSYHVILMRLRQEYETIKGLILSSEIEKKHGFSQLQKAMQKVQKYFGEETVNIALDVTLRVGLHREKLRTIMLSDHYIKYKMNIETLDGQMEFLNCPIFASHKYISDKLGIPDSVSALFCKYFCYSHAKAMLETVIPFPFTLWHPKRMATHGKCDFYLKLAYSPSADHNKKFIPLVLSWNITRKCNLKCSHCYINATTKELKNELTTFEAKNLINQISEVSRPLLILSGGEPLLRSDVFELIKYGVLKGLKMGLGSNGSLIDSNVAYNLKKAGISTVSISLDSCKPMLHDQFRAVAGSWEKAVNAIQVLRENNVLVQVNTTVTQQNYEEIDDIMTLTENLGVENFHLFFLVPTGRGTKMSDITPKKYEEMIKTTFAKTSNHNLNVRPSCAPQFMRIARNQGLDMRQWIRGCIAGLYYCRIYPDGEITPCPYLPIKLGNIREKSFKDIWFNSKLFNSLRNFKSLKGKCGYCEYSALCGGCRARAYGLSSDFIDYCGDLHEPKELKGDYLAEDPWCTYIPTKSIMK
jgi:radical SAM protein with 4Fe4S-binding SPASM domain